MAISKNLLKTKPELKFIIHKPVSNLPPKEERLQIIKSCERCPFSSGNKDSKDCQFQTHQKCNCEVPLPDERKKVFTDFDAFGLCKHCGHYIIRVNQGQWFHYHRYYTCKPPFSSKSCIAPIFHKTDNRNKNQISTEINEL